jgi:pyruvate dehydrogenase E2 component (dihydrolipoamide acetyltransferase)
LLAQQIISHVTDECGHDAKAASQISHVGPLPAASHQEVTSQSRLAWLRPLLRTHLSEGNKVPVGTALAVVRVDREEGGEMALATAAAPPAASLPQPTEAPTPPAILPPEAVRLRASPLARRLAEELNVDLAQIKGSGPGGAIQRADVERAAAEAVRAATAPPVDNGTALRSAIARAMARSKREIPHYYLGIDVDLQRALSWLEEENRKRPVTDRLLYAALLLKEVALATREVPELNGFWIDDAFRASADVHVGVAISLRTGGLVAPAIHHTDRLSLNDLMVSLRDLVARARRGVLRSSELSDPTITVTNLGEQSVPTVFGVIYPPQVALVGFGTITERPWAVGGLLGIRPVITATLSADHRASDGHRGGLFLAAVNRLLKEPEKLC